MEWVFSGIGTAIISWIIGVIIGGIAGHRIAKNKYTIIQKGRDRNDMTQINEL